MLECEQRNMSIQGKKSMLDEFDINTCFDLVS